MTKQIKCNSSGLHSRLFIQCFIWR